jgi:hypothetical protein
MKCPTNSEYDVGTWSTYGMGLAKKKYFSFLWWQFLKRVKYHEGAAATASKNKE